jgi:hypothetical protein
MIPLFVSYSSGEAKNRGRVYVVNGDEEHDGDDSSAADDVLKFSEKHEFEVRRKDLRLK